MSRYKGTFIFGANFEGGSTVPIDARQLVCTYADLTLPATWCFSPVCSSMALYDGMLTVVASGACSGAYWLCDWTNYTNSNSWVRIGAGTGTLSNACNGLHTINSGTTVVLGGTLLSGTTINLSGKTLILSGTTGSAQLFVGNVAGKYGNIVIDTNYLTLETQNGSNCAYIDFNQANSTINLCTIGGKINIDSSNRNLYINTSSGASYCANYCLCNTINPRWIPDKAYVDNKMNVVNVRCTFPNSFPSGFTLVSTDNFIGVTGYTAGSCACILLLDDGGGLQAGQTVTIADIQGCALIYPIYIDGNGHCITNTFNGCAMINTNNGSITFLYAGNFWTPIAFIN